MTEREAYECSVCDDRCKTSSEDGCYVWCPSCHQWVVPRPKNNARSQSDLYDEGTIADELLLLFEDDLDD